MKIVKVRLKSRSYDIIIGRGLLKKCGAILKRLKIGRDAVIITNARLASMYRKPVESTLAKSNLTVRFELVPDSERAKSSRFAVDLVNRISVYDKHKDIFVVALGGGVIGDLAGFVSSMYKRGIPYVQIPTTLLAQVDSSIGGKVAIDLPVAKNLIGAFYQPKAVISDISLIETLPARQLKSGLAEVIKYALIKDKGLLKFLETGNRKILNRDEKALEHIISRCSRIKADIVAMDEFDKKGIRAILNFGHTIGHAIEAATGYSSRYTHGEAISIGMVCASDLSFRLGMIALADLKRIKNLISKIGLPTAMTDIDITDIYEAHLHDKKFIFGRNKFILLESIGRAKVVESVPDFLIKAVLRDHLRR